MKRLWISLAIILLLSGAAGWHVSHLTRLVGDMTTLLEEASTALKEGDHPGAQALTREALSIWESQSDYLHNTLRHADMDAILISFQEVLSYPESQVHSGACAAALARLIAQLELIVEAERPTLTNLL